jgi:hypothetical protein
LKKALKRQRFVRFGLFLWIRRGSTEGGFDWGAFWLIGEYHAKIESK